MIDSGLQSLFACNSKFMALVKRASEPPKGLEGEGGEQFTLDKNRTLLQFSDLSITRNTTRTTLPGGIGMPHFFYLNHSSFLISIGRLSNKLASSMCLEMPHAPQKTNKASPLKMILCLRFS